jgi:hypothetical protein
LVKVRVAADTVASPVSAEVTDKTTLDGGWAPRTAVNVVVVPVSLTVAVVVDRVNAEVGVGTAVGVTTGVGTAVGVTIGVGTAVGVTIGVGTAVGVTTGVGTAVGVTTGVGTAVGVTTGVGTGVGKIISILIVRVGDGV